MKILVTGANGFIGSYIAKNFIQRGYNCYATNKSTLDLTNNKHVNKFFDEHGHDFKAIIHCAVSGREKLHRHSRILYQNLLMFENIIRHADKSDVFISYGSGAELYMAENDYYGMSKYTIARRMEQYPNTTNIRLYGCFGEHEKEERFIKHCINRCLQNKPIMIQNRVMDFIYIEDVYNVTKFVVDNHFFGTIDAVYNLKQSLSNIAHYIKSVTQSQSEITVSKQEYMPYCSSGTDIDIELLKNKNFLPLVGFETGINNMIEYIKKEIYETNSRDMFT